MNARHPSRPEKLDQRQDRPPIIRFDMLEGALETAASRTALFSDPVFHQALFDRLDALIPPGGILSVDVFDTFLLRDDVSELSRFVEIGNRMAKHVGVESIEAFLARHLGTNASYRAGPRVNGCGEGSLTEIHRTASRLLGCGDDMTDAFIGIELEYEAERLARNALLADYAERHRRRGGRIVMISDMYMHTGQIETLLARVGIETGLFDGVFSSADTKVSKASGGIFPLVEKALDAKPADFLHVGDSFKSDYRQPRSRGWRALHLPVPRTAIEARRRCHHATAGKLFETHGLIIDVPLPH